MKLLNKSETKAVAGGIIAGDGGCVKIEWTIDIPTNPSEPVFDWCKTIELMPYEIYTRSTMILGST